MKVEEAIVYLLAEKNGGMTAEQLASAINDRCLLVRRDGQPISVKQVWWAVKNFPGTLTYSDGRIFLMI